MGQEYFINSQELQDKVANLLPSQGGAGAGFDLSASTQIIPIIDLTESAEGSNFRQDLQRASSFSNSTSFSVSDATTTIVNNTGYFLITGSSTVTSKSGGSFNKIKLSDGFSTKVIWGHDAPSSQNFATTVLNISLLVFLEAGHTCSIESFTSDAICIGSTRQIATIDGTLVNP